MGRSTGSTTARRSRRRTAPKTEVASASQALAQGSVKEKNRTYYEVYMLSRTEATPEADKHLSFVCLRPDGAIESPSTVSLMCRSAKKKVPGLEDFHFHMLRHTFTSNLLSHGAAPKDVQELLGHSDVNTTMNIYAHATREAKRSSARLLDKVVSSG